MHNVEPLPHPKWRLTKERKDFVGVYHPCAVEWEASSKAATAHVVRYRIAYTYNARVYLDVSVRVYVSVFVCIWYMCMSDWREWKTRIVWYLFRIDYISLECVCVCFMCLCIAHAVERIRWLYLYFVIYIDAQWLMCFILFYFFFSRNISVCVCAVWLGSFHSNSIRSNAVTSLAISPCIYIL